jgi:hypothetical protein
MKAENANTWVRLEKTFLRYKKASECRQGDKETVWFIRMSLCHLVPWSRCLSARGKIKDKGTGRQRDRVTRGHWDKETTWMRVRRERGNDKMKWYYKLPCLRHECLSDRRGHGAIAPGEVEKKAANANAWVRWEETFLRYKKATECRRGDKATMGWDNLSASKIYNQTMDICEDQTAAQFWKGTSNTVAFYWLIASKQKYLKWLFFRFGLYWCAFTAPAPIKYNFERIRK